LPERACEAQARVGQGFPDCVTLNLFQGPRPSKAVALTRWMLKRVQHDGWGERLRGAGEPPQANACALTRYTSETAAARESRQGIEEGAVELRRADLRFA